MVARQSWTIFAGLLVHIRAKIKRTVSRTEWFVLYIGFNFNFWFKFVGLHACFNPSEENKVYQRYYQWISLVFIVQAITLHIPAYLWKLSEGGLMHKICNQLGMIKFKNKFYWIKFKNHPFLCLTDATFMREKLNDKKKCSQYVDRLHTKYVRCFILFNVLSGASIVSV